MDQYNRSLIFRSLQLVSHGNILLINNLAELLNKQRFVRFFFYLIVDAMCKKV